MSRPGPGAPPRSCVCGWMHVYVCVIYALYNVGKCFIVSVSFSPSGAKVLGVYEWVFGCFAVDFRWMLFWFFFPIVIFHIRILWLSPFKNNYNVQ